VVTGNLGSDIAESARVVHALLKARAAAFGITDAIEKDLHIHVVDTEVTTDGRSAGIAIALASLSALEQRPLCEGLAASGEITLHGAIRPVAGIHEKLVAAYLHGITKVLMPRKNLFDVRGLASDATSRLELHFVDTLEEALEHAFFRQARKNPAANLV
jgi:ATP-dependent Lon protease